MFNIKEYPLLEKVWKCLLKKLPKGYRNMMCHVSLTGMPYGKGIYDLRKGAIAPSSAIVIGIELIEKFKNDEYVICQIIAHELGHHVLGHIHSYASSIHQEQDADQFGLTLALMCGYKGTKYLEASIRYEKWRKKGISNYHKKTHGTAEDRTKKLKDQLEYLGINDGKN